MGTLIQYITYIYYYLPSSRTNVIYYVFDSFATGVSWYFTTIPLIVYTNKFMYIKSKFIRIAMPFPCIKPRISHYFSILSMLLLALYVLVGTLWTVEFFYPDWVFRRVCDIYFAVLLIVMSLQIIYSVVVFRKIELEKSLERIKLIFALYAVVNAV